MWLCGHSIVRWTHRQAVMSPGDSQLGLNGEEILSWYGRRAEGPPTFFGSQGATGHWSCCPPWVDKARWYMNQEVAKSVHQWEGSNNYPSKNIIMGT